MSAGAWLNYSLLRQSESTEDEDGALAGDDRRVSILCTSKK